MLNNYQNISNNKVNLNHNFFDILQISTKIWIIFLIGHFTMGFYIMYKDLKGDWENYKIHPDSLTDKNNKLIKYTLCIPYLLRDLFFLLPIFLFIYTSFNINFLTENFDLYGFAYEIFIKCPIAYMIGNLWDMMIHRLWHQIPFLYKHVHKEHHINIAEMCSLSAWRDSWLEFIFEIPGTFLIGPYFMRLNWLSHALIISSMGFISSIDHSGFYVNYLIDSRYHYNHHLKPNNNFADIEVLDNLFGTNLHN